jgi:hypothetical protein
MKSAILSGTEDIRAAAIGAAEARVSAKARANEIAENSAAVQISHDRYRLTIRVPQAERYSYGVEVSKGISRNPMRFHAARHMLEPAAILKDKRQWKSV